MLKKILRKNRRKRKKKKQTTEMEQMEQKEDAIAEALMAAILSKVYIEQPDMKPEFRNEKMQSEEERLRKPFLVASYIRKHFSKDPSDTWAEVAIKIEDNILNPMRWKRNTKGELIYFERFRRYMTKYYPNNMGY